MKKHAILNAFQATRTWPISQKKWSAKLRSYRPPNPEMLEREEDYGFPQNILSLDKDLCDTATATRALADCDPTQLLDSDVLFYKITLQKAGVELQNPHLTSYSYTNLK